MSPVILMINGAIAVAPWQLERLSTGIKTSPVFSRKQDRGLEGKASTQIT